mgnify:CR=1 FL=1
MTPVVLIAEELAEGEELEHFARGKLPNSALTTEGGAVGASWFGERAWFGASANTYRSNYGIPPGAHALPLRRRRWRSARHPLRQSGRLPRLGCPRRG